MLCVLMVDSMSVAVHLMLSLKSVVSPPPGLIGEHGGEVMYFG